MPRGYPSYGGTLGNLEIRRGDIEAQRALSSGNVWGNAIRDIGQQIGGYFEKRAEEKQLAKRDAAIAATIEGWDGQDPRQLLIGLTRIAGPEAGPKMAQGVMAFHALGEQAEEKDVQAAARGFASMPPSLQERYWPGIREKAAPLFEKLFGDDISAVEYSPELAQTIAQLGGVGRKEEGYTLSPGQARFRGGEKIAEVPAAAKEEKRYKVTVPGPGGRPIEKLVTESELEKGIQGYVPPRAPREGITPTAAANLTMQLARQQEAAAKPVKELLRQKRFMDAGLERARQGDMNSGSQAVLVTFQKILDPTSVVRESEYARSAHGISLLGRIEGARDRLIEGGAGVPKHELEAFARLADDFMRGATEDYDAQVQRIGKTADYYGIPKEHVISNYGFSANADIPTVKTPEEAARLPKGTRFRTPDGRIKVVP